MDPILQHHYENLANGTAVTNEDGSISTVFTVQVDLNGKPTLIPTVWEGRILPEEEAAQRAMESGIQWPTARSHEELRNYDIELHKQMQPMSQQEARSFLEIIKAGKRDNF